MKKAAARAEVAIRAHVQTLYAGANAFTIGAVEIDPKHLAVWITTLTDAQRDALSRDPGLKDHLRGLLAQASYPAASIPLVGFAFESEETVRRDHGGNWWYAIK